MAKNATDTNRDYNQQMQKFKENIKTNAEDLVLKTFPRKTLELHNLLESPDFSWLNLDKIRAEINIPIPEYPFVVPLNSVNQNNHDDSTKTNATSSDESNGTASSSKKRKYYSLEKDEECGNNSSNTTNQSNSLQSSKNNGGSRVLVLPYGSVPCNKHIVELIDVVKPLIRQLVEDCNLLKMWVLFLIPRIEDGNNFGVSIQEETLSEIRTVEAEAAAYFDQMSRYFLTRAKIVTKIAKYPHVEDFRRNVSEIDEKEFVSLRLIVAELRNHYASLHDIVTKNLEKIKTPRSQHQSMTMY